MKAAKPLAVLVILSLVAALGVLLLYPAGQSRLLLGEVTAAPIDGAPATLAVFMTLHNPGGPDRLVNARSIVAQRARLASSVTDAGLPIPSDSAPMLAPDGAHILMDGVGGALKEGRMIPLTLRFENAGEIRTQARVTTPRAQGDAPLFGLFGIGDICTVGDGEPAPRIELTVEPDGDGWVVRVLADDFNFTADTTDTVHVPGTGHGHLYVGGLKLQRMYEPEAHIGALPRGDHQVRVTLNTNDHRSYVVNDQPVSATATISVP